MNFVIVKILRFNWTCCNYKNAAEAELNYFT